MPIRNVLFDWRGTLFDDEPEVDWIIASARDIGRTLAHEQAHEIACALARVEDAPDVRAARLRAEASPAVHRAGALLWYRRAGLDDALAVAIYERDGSPEATFPFSDASLVLAELRRRGVHVGIASNVHYDIRPHFHRHGLLDLVDSFTLSCECGHEKPEAEFFARALEDLGATAEETLMVGDRADTDGGAAAAGICTLILPPTLRGAPHGLDAVLNLVG
jgi:FMN phosphatase YigB (HAD superfamily)